MLESDEVALPAPGGGDTIARWAALARWGRTDLPLARLAEGHTDAVAILRELGGRPHRHACYGVWAARPGGVGAELNGEPRRLTGTVRFCSGARDLDRALVVAAAPDGMRLVDLALDQPGVGGGGVAAVWLGGAAGVLDDVLPFVGADPHRLAHVGALHAELQAVDALLVRTAETIDADPTDAHRTAVWTARAAAERVCRSVLDRAPLAAGAAGMASSATLGPRLADLQVFIRQHHGERDLAALGAAVTEVVAGVVAGVVTEAR
jgi:hypothetical protein